MTADELYAQTLAGYDQQIKYAEGSRNDINKAYMNMYNEQAGYGKSQELALNQDYARQAAAMQQSMMDRGLVNTTVLDSAQRGVNYDRANSLLSLQDQLAQRQLGIKEGRLG